MGADGGQLRIAREVHLDEVALAPACTGLAEFWPERSAKRRLTPMQMLSFAAILALAVSGGVLLGNDALAWLRPLGWGLFGALILLRVGSAAVLLVSPARQATSGWIGELPVYTILCPLYREAGEVRRLIASLEQLDYPKDRMDVKLLLEADDAETLAAARIHARPWLELLILEPCLPRTKPKALNAGLARARGRFLTVYDAEDAPHPQQLRAALASFARGGSELACLQAPLLIDNAHRSWVSQQFAAEYAIQFLGLNPLLARLGWPFPLGGTSNHFRTEALRATGGWDACNVTEDADIGYRLARDGWTLGLIEPPTREEAPLRLIAWLRQRSRWIKGHLQTWLVLMREPDALMRELGWRRFWAVQAVLGGGLCAALAHGPLLGVTLLAISVPGWPLHPLDLAFLIAGLVASLIAAVAASARLRSWSLLRAALTMPLYWPLGSLAAMLALCEFVRRPFHWAKTEHGCRAALR